MAERDTHTEAGRRGGRLSYGLGVRAHFGYSAQKASGQNITMKQLSPSLALSFIRASGLLL